MYKGERGFAVLLKKSHRLCFLIAGVFLFLAMTSFHSSVVVKDYVERIGEISDIEEVRIYRHQRYVTGYNYRLTWTLDGEEYEKYFKEHLEDTQLYSVLVFILCIIGIAIQLGMSYADYKKGEYVNPVMFDFSIACGVIAVICGVLFIRAKIILKRRYA